MKEKLHSKSFWISLVSAVLIFIQAIGIKVDVPAVNEVVSAVLTLLVVLGIISSPGGGSGGEAAKDTAAKSEEKVGESENKSALKGAE